MNITTTLSSRYWLSVRGLTQRTTYSDTAIRQALKDAVRGGGS